MTERPRRALGPGGGALPRGPRGFGWVVALAAGALLVIVTVNSLRTTNPTPAGLAAGRALPSFAAPLALSDLDGDANVAAGRDGGAAGARPACEVRGPDVLTSCVLARRGPVALAFYATRGAQCEAFVDRLDDARARFPGLQAAVVAVRGDREDLRRTIRERRWRLPVAFDRDGAVSNLYGVAVCPQTTFALRGGRVRRTVLGDLDARALDRQLRAVYDASRRAGWTPPR